MSDTRGNEQDPLPASPEGRASVRGGTSSNSSVKNAASRRVTTGRVSAKSADATENAGAARGREPGRPAMRVEAAGRTAARRIGIRELRQEASRYVELAEKGYTVDITNRGRLVAQLVPVREPDSALERLIAAGIIEPAEEPGGIAGLEPYPPSMPEDQA